MAPTPDPIDLPEIPDGYYPEGCVTDDDKMRYRIAFGTAQKLMEGEDDQAILMTARSLYDSDLPT